MIKSMPLLEQTSPHLSATAWLILKAKLTNQAKTSAHKHPLFILVPDSEMALELTSEIDAFYGIKGAAEAFVALETNLTRGRGPLRHTKNLRLRALCAAHCCAGFENTRAVVFASDAMCQPVLKKQSLLDSLLEVKKGDQLSRTDFVSRLVDAGYLPAEVVEAPGTFAVRGSIVDFFCPTHDNPTRVEMFGDDVQSIRSFDPKTQRRIAEFEAISICPSQEFLYDSDKQASSIFKAYADRHDWIRSTRLDVVERLQNQTYFATLDYWVRVLNPTRFYSFNLFFNDLGAHSFDWVVYPQQCTNQLRLAQTKQASDLKNARQENEWVPEPDDFVYRLFEDTESQINLISRSHHQISLSNQPSEELKSNSLLATQIASSRHDSADPPLQPLYEFIDKHLAYNSRFLFTSTTLSQLERLDFFLSSKGIKPLHFEKVPDFLSSKSTFGSTVSRITSGFFDAQSNICIITDEEIFGKRKKSSQTKKHSKTNVFSSDLSLLTLEPGDYVSQSQHGIGKYVGLKSMSLNGINNDLIEIEYSGNNKLFVPVSRLNTVQRIGGKETQIALDKLGGSTWEAKKAKAKKEIRSIATELISLYSKRQLTLGPKIIAPKSEVMKFASTFAFEETVDQTKAIDECLNDLKGPKPMDRVLCGDVGYGKTEVALRTAHAALVAGFQVAVLVPTTILAAQHEALFKKRLEPFGFRVRGVSRFKQSKEFKEVIDGLRGGTIDLVVGTHRLLSDQVVFKNLGLIVVDEEQRFGVTHKEKLKRIKSNVHVLTMTATPIPRTLNMAISGLRDLSIISTPPVDRLSVKTSIARKKPSLIQDAIRNELARDGQVFYLHNRIQDISLIEEEINHLVPEAKTSVVHGQMDEVELEKRMLDFYEGKTQVLITTTIIESGLDVPNANTLIVERANNFGLSQLYQIRGRVGRSSEKAFAYFLIPESGAITKEAEDRLQVLETYQELGSGFHIASHDLDIRGSGDLLGRSQSGHMTAIGFDTYVSLLQECVAEQKGDQIEQDIDPEISLPIPSNIPAEYIPDIGLRLSYYKKLASTETDEQILEIEQELEDRFGRPPQSVFNLLRMMKIKSLLRSLGVKALTSGKLGFSLIFDASSCIDRQKLVETVARYPQNYEISADAKLVIKMPGGLNNESDMLKMAESAIEHLFELTT